MMNKLKSSLPLALNIDFSYYILVLKDPVQLDHRLAVLKIFMIFKGALFII